MDINCYLKTTVILLAFFAIILVYLKFIGNKQSFHSHATENSHTSGWPSKAMVQGIMDELDNVKLITGDARSVNTIITDIKFDFVFHDANHTRDAIIGDLIALKDILNPNAFVAVHNSSYDEPLRNFYGKSALDYLQSEGHYKIIKTADTATLIQLV